MDQNPQKKNLEGRKPKIDPFTETSNIFKSLFYLYQKNIKWTKTKYQRHHKKKKITKTKLKSIIFVWTKNIFKFNFKELIDGIYRLLSFSCKKNLGVIDMFCEPIIFFVGFDPV